MRYKHTIVLLAAALATSAGLTAGTLFTPAKAGNAKIESNSVTIHGTSTLHEWDVKGSTINGSIDANPELSKGMNAESWKKAGDPPATVKVVIPVTSIHSESAKMDSLMLKALKAKAFPEVRYEMTGATPAANSSSVKSRGKLTIAGVTRDVVMDVTATRDGDTRYVLTGASSIKMSDYGIKPPTAMLGTIRSGDVVKVTFRWVVERAQ